MKTLTSSLLLFLSTLLLTPAAAAIDQAQRTTNRINGISEFLIERAHENYFYIFEQKLKDDKKNLACYFPTTYSYVAEGDLRLLLTSREVWDDALTRDLDLLIARVVADKIKDSIGLRKIALEVSNGLLKLVPFITVKINGVEYKLDQVQKEWPESVKNTINAFYVQPNTLTETMLDIEDKLSLYAKESKCNTPHISIEQLSSYYVQLEQAIKGFSGWIDFIKTQKVNLGIDKNEVKKKCRSKPDAFICKIQDTQGKIVKDWLPVLEKEFDKPVNKVVGVTAATVALTVSLKKYMARMDSVKTNTQKVLDAIKQLKESHLDDHIDMRKFKKHVLFFAQLSDADSGDEVKAIMSSYTLPAVSFFAKREKNSHHIMVTSYLGYGAGEIENPAPSGEENDTGVIAPIGLEYSIGWPAGWSTSLMFAPFDFGYPVSLKLNGITKDLEYEEIVAPAVYLALGVKEYPLNFGIAYQEGIKRENSSETENRILLFVAFDMPLFALY